MKSSEWKESGELLIPPHPVEVARGSRWKGTAGEREVLASSLLLWLAFPPVNAWWLAWLAPLGWIRLISAPDGRTPIRWSRIYLLSLIHWLLMIQWIRLPHWSAYFGWLALSLYLALYPPAFIAISRMLVHHWQWPSIAVVPIVWTGLELARAHLLTGFAMSLLGHTQRDWPHVAQLADCLGVYGISFLIMAVAASVERLIPRDGRRVRKWTPGLTIVTLLAATLAYGSHQLNHFARVNAEADRTFRAALIQGAFDTEFDGDPERGLERTRNAFLDYMRLSQQAAREHPSLDLVIWPESMFTAGQPMITYDEPLQVIEGWDASVTELRQRLDDYAAAARSRAAWIAQQTKTPLLVGLEWDHFRGGREFRYNSAVHFGVDGQVVTRYDKMHRVMFGEYVPLGELFPWLYRLTPMRDGLTPGRQPVAMNVAGVRIAPTICFENTVPQLVRRQCQELAARGESPDLLVTITNDGWFWGSSLLDVHLTCGVFRAIEMRRPLLIAANTGFSAWVDSTGAVRAQGPRRAEGVVAAAVPIPDQPAESLYFRYGDWLASSCLFVCLLAVLRPWVGRWRWPR